MSSSSRSLTLTIFSGSLRLVFGVDQLVHCALDHQKRRDIVIDAEDGGDPAVSAANVHGGGLEDLAVRGLGEVAQMVARLRVGLPYLLEHDVRCAVAHLAPGDMTVFDGNDGMLGVLGAHIVDHHLAMAAKGRGDALCDLLQGLQRCGFYGLSLL